MNGKSSEINYDKFGKCSDDNGLKTNIGII